MWITLPPTRPDLPGLDSDRPERSGPVRSTSLPTVGYFLTKKNFKTTGISNMPSDRVGGSLLRSWLFLIWESSQVETTQHKRNWGLVFDIFPMWGVSK